MRDMASEVHSAVPNSSRSFEAGRRIREQWTSLRARVEKIAEDRLKFAGENLTNLQKNINQARTEAAERRQPLFGGGEKLLVDQSQLRADFRVAVDMGITFNPNHLTQEQQDRMPMLEQAQREHLFEGNVTNAKLVEWNNEKTDRREERIVVARPITDNDPNSPQAYTVYKLATDGHYVRELVYRTDLKVNTREAVSSGAPQGMTMEEYKIFKAARDADPKLTWEAWDKAYRNPDAKTASKTAAPVVSTTSAPVRASGESKTSTPVAPKVEVKTLDTNKKVKDPDGDSLQAGLSRLDGIFNDLHEDETLAQSNDTDHDWAEFNKEEDAYNVQDTLLTSTDYRKAGKADSSIKKPETGKIDSTKRYKAKTKNADPDQAWYDSPEQQAERAARAKIRNDKYLEAVQNESRYGDADAFSKPVNPEMKTPPVKPVVERTAENLRAELMADEQKLANYRASIEQTIQAGIEAKRAEIARRSQSAVVTETTHNTPVGEAKSVVAEQPITNKPAEATQSSVDQTASVAVEATVPQQTVHTGAPEATVEPMIAEQLGPVNKPESNESDVAAESTVNTQPVLIRVDDVQPQRVGSAPVTSSSTENDRTVVVSNGVSEPAQQAETAPVSPKPDSTVNKRMQIVNSLEQLAQRGGITEARLDSLMKQAQNVAGDDLDPLTIFGQLVDDELAKMPKPEVVQDSGEEAINSVINAR